MNNEPCTLHSHIVSIPIGFLLILNVLQSTEHDKLQANDCIVLGLHFSGDRNNLTLVVEQDVYIKYYVMLNVLNQIHPDDQS